MGNRADFYAIAWAALRAGALPKVMNFLGIVIGLAGTLMLVPAFADENLAIVQSPQPVQIFLELAA